MTSERTTFARLTALLGQQIGLSDWMAMDQSRIDGFAKVTEDEQYIHVDPVRAAQSPFGGPIAHGFLTLSMLSAMATSAVPFLGRAKMAINYGFEKVRFLEPVPSGKRIRGAFGLHDIREHSADRWLLSIDASVQIESIVKPALAATWLVLMEPG